MVLNDSAITPEPLQLAMDVIERFVLHRLNRRLTVDL
ncbi:hypothetical protein PS838_01133 [Pseudomonas fluorescens]|nr:hypothetical protein PS838_01133 [Pseudomonas fluorescens]